MDAQGLSLLIAFGGGMLSFVSPCILPLVPAYLGHLAGQSATMANGSTGRSQTFFHALAFVLGFSVIFVVMGASVGLLGGLVYANLPFLRQVGGLILIILGLHVAGVLRLKFLYREKRLHLGPSARLGYGASFVVGLTFAIGWTPCVGTILGTILVLASTTETAWQGAYLLAAYSAGLGMPFLAAGLALTRIRGVLATVNRHMNVISAISGALLIGMGIAVYADWLSRLSTYFYWTVGGL
ncbi:MAG: sulfite exporter TauE/SafE family protein [Chloroflexi bacterium]|nr:sulfite exporter TauE/SafE family protein [Chloroflexota bacterium]